MRKNILIICVLTLLPLSVLADSVNLDCPKEVSESSEFTCKLTGSAANNISGVTMNYSFGSSLKFISFTKDSIWTFGDGTDGQISLSLDNDIKGNFNIGTFKFKSSGNNNTISIYDVSFYDANIKANKVEGTSVNVAIKIKDNVPSPNTDKNNEKNNSSSSNNNTDFGNKNSNDIENDSDNENENTDSSIYLSNLIVDNYTLSFNKEIFIYTLKIKDEDTLKIIPYLEDNDSNYSISGNENLTNGSIIEITVYSKEGNQATYKINIQKDNQKIADKKNYTFMFIVIIVVLLIINVVRMVVGRRNKNEKNN